MDYSAIILAAGKGTRMRSELPKCACKLLGKPMINYILEALREASIKDICVILGHKREILEDILKDSVEYAYQAEQLGTGHAVICAKDYYAKQNGLILIFPGDMPLIKGSTIKELIDTHINNKNDLTVVSTIVNNPFGYGRIVKENNQVLRIVEEKEATEEEKKIKEINAALYCINANLLEDALSKINNNNNKGEYYLTDIVEILAPNKKVDTFIIKDPLELTGINDPETLKQVEEEILKRQK